MGSAADKKASVGNDWLRSAEEAAISRYLSRHVLCYIRREISQPICCLMARSGIIGTPSCGMRGCHDLCGGFLSGNASRLHYFRSLHCEQPGFVSLVVVLAYALRGPYKEEEAPCMQPVDLPWSKNSLLGKDL